MVAPVIIGAAIAGGASLLGGALAKRPEPARSVPDYTHMKEGVQWRVEDAKRAGVHPVYAMGFNPGSPGAITTGSTGPSSSAVMGRSLASAGQNIGSAVATLPRQEQQSWAREQQQMTRDRHSVDMMQAQRDFVGSSAAASAGARAEQYPSTPRETNLWDPASTQIPGQGAIAGPDTEELLWGAAARWYRDYYLKNAEKRYFRDLYRKRYPGRARRYDESISYPEVMY